MASHQVNIAAFIPRNCPAPGRHLMRRRGGYILTWRPCTCPSALAAPGPGHKVARCLDCHVDGIDTVVLDPPCTRHNRTASGGSDSSAGPGVPHERDRRC